MSNKVVDKDYLKCQFQNFYSNILLCCFPKINDSTASSTSTYSSSKIDTLLGCKVDIDSLATVATTGCYSDLIGAPSSITSAICDQCGNVINETYVSCLDSGIDSSTCTYANKLYTPSGALIGNIEEVEFAHCASTAAYDDAGNCIVCYYAASTAIPTDNCQLINGCGYTTCTGDVLSSSLATVATSGCYCDLTDKPTYNATTDIITATGFSGALSGTATNATCDASGNVITSTYATKNEMATHTATFRGSFSSWSAVPDLASGYCCNYAGYCSPSPNDYMVVQDATGYNASCVGQYRFKYNSETWEDSCSCKNNWVPEYRVNEVLDTTPTQNSTNGITSGAVYTGLSSKANCTDIPTDNCQLSNGCNYTTIKSISSCYDSIPVMLCTGTTNIGGSSDCAFTFNPSIGYVCAPTFYGCFSGNLSGRASSAIYDCQGNFLTHKLIYDGIINTNCDYPVPFYQGSYYAYTACNANYDLKVNPASGRVSGRCICASAAMIIPVGTSNTTDGAIWITI